MMKKINNKGYMLVEIIVAFSLAIAIMYLITELTVKVKNRNDDLRVRTLTASDQAIIYNMIMKDVQEGIAFNCSNVGITKSSGIYKVTYDGKTNILNEYVDSVSCRGNIIHIGVKVLDDTFDVVIPGTPSAGDTPMGEEERVEIRIIYDTRGGTKVEDTVSYIYPNAGSCLEISVYQPSKVTDFLYWSMTPEPELLEGPFFRHPQNPQYTGGIRGPDGEDVQLGGSLGQCISHSIFDEDDEYVVRLYAVYVDDYQ